MSKNKKFLIFICVVALIGGVNIALSGLFDYLLIYAVVMGISIPMGYFNYTLCKWSSRWYSRLYHRNPVDPEPSDLKLILEKITFWVCYGFGLLLSLLCTFL